ncbi:DUF2946 family protein [Acinetobacter calcoaceticus]|uniref:DUF2946 family protein n=1 Tax=Acinetobacter calcoaceticus TaxID=471 RepID=A0A4R1XSV9_ACICA|nr:DUF2946 family protein [Acinetobacter calcoaceticus]
MNVLLLRSGLLLGFAAVLLQIAVFIQPLLPVQYQIAPVCETITQAFAQTQFAKPQHSTAMQHTKHNPSLDVAPKVHDHHDPSHQCQYCTVYGNLILPPELEINAVIDRIQVRLVAFQKASLHVYFLLQRLFLLPQGRAPPLFA